MPMLGKPSLSLDPPSWKDSLCQPVSVGMPHETHAEIIAACCADDSMVQSPPDAGTCTEVVSADRLVQLSHERAQAAVDAGSTVRAMPVSLAICTVYVQAAGICLSWVCCTRGCMLPCLHVCGVYHVTCGTV